jgi:hypothetical protein
MHDGYFQASALARFLPLENGGGCLMRSMALQKYSVAAMVAALATTAAHAINLSLDIPLSQLQLAWTLTRVLLQL